MVFVLTREFISLSATFVNNKRSLSFGTFEKKILSNCIELRERVIYHHLRSLDFVWSSVPARFGVLKVVV